MSSTSSVSRRQFLASAAALGATAAWAVPSGRETRVVWRESRERYPEGVASGDPSPDSVILWTRHPGSSSSALSLVVEVAEDPAFTRVIAHSTTTARRELDWTCRVLVGALRSRTTYWYRFTDADGAGSRIGRTRTAPLQRRGRAV